MTCCALRPCERYLATEGQLSHVRRRVCPVCWWGDRTQPETLLATREREEVERRVKALGPRGSHSRRGQRRHGLEATEREGWR
jgi:hypothetical protein